MRVDRAVNRTALTACLRSVEGSQEVSLYASYFQLIEKDGRIDDAMRDVERAVFDIDIVASRDQIAAQGAGVQIVEHCPAHKLFVTVLGPDLVKQPGRAQSAHGFYVIPKGQLALLTEFDEFLFQLFRRRGLGRVHDEVSQAWPGVVLGQLGTAVAV